MRRIGVDLDGTIYDFFSMFKKLAMEQGEEDYGDPTHYQFIDTAVSPKTWKWMWTEGVTDGLFFLGKAYPGALDGIKKLEQMGEIFVVTHRPFNARGDTLHWLAFSDVSPGAVIFENQEPKWTSGIVPGCDIYFEDQPLEIQNLLDNTEGYVVTFERSYNHQILPPFEHERLVVLPDWYHLDKGLAEIERRKNGG